MFNYFLRSIKKRLPLLVLLIGNGGLLFASVVAKTIMDAYDYGIFALLLTLLSVLNAFGLLGAEQAFLRVTRVAGSIVYAKKGDLLLLLLFGGLSVLAVLVFLGMKGFHGATYYCMALSSVLVIANMFFYNFYRLNGLFVLSQAVLNLWKIVAGAVTLLAAVVDIGNVLILTFVSILMSMLVMNVVALLKLRSSLVICSGWSGTRYIWGYLFSMGTLMAIANIDRFLIESYFGITTFGDYFYMVSVFVSPFLVMAAYVGFASLGEYKRNFQLNTLWRNLAGLFVLSGLGVFLYYFSIRLVVDLGWIQSPFVYGVLVPVLMLSTAVVRVCYSSLSAAMGAVGVLSYIYISNGLSLLVAALGVVFMVYGGFKMTILLVAMMILLFWLARFCLYAWAISRGHHAGLRA